MDGLRILYQYLNDNISIPEEKKIRNIVKGTKIPVRDLDALEDLTDIFGCLEERGYIGLIDLGYLKDILGLISRPRLIEKVEEFERKQKLSEHAPRDSGTLRGGNTQSGASGYTGSGNYTGQGLTVTANPSGTNTQPEQSTCDSSDATGIDDTDSARFKNGTKKSVLLVNDEWGTSKGGISTVHRQLAEQAKDAGFDVYVTALELNEEDAKDANEKGINVITARKKGYTPPDLTWINTTHRTYFPKLEEEIPNLSVIVGHIPITSEGALDIRKERFAGKGVKVFLFNHVIPEDIEEWKSGSTPETTDEKENRILEQVKEADAVFSVGPRMFNHFDNNFRALPEVVHFLYIPLPDKPFFDISIKPPSENNPVIKVLALGRVDGVGKLKGYDVMAAAMSRVCDLYHNAGLGQPPILVIRGIPEGKHEQSQEFIKKHVKSKYLKITLRPYGTQDQIRQDMKTSHLFVMPSRSEPFGMVGIEAIAAGLPTLLTTNSGLAELVVKRDIFGSRDGKSMVVDVGLNDADLEDDIKIWEEHIKSVLLRDEYEENFKHAQDLKQRLKKLPAIKKTHEDFVKELVK
ncbi:uncharacterized protein LOC144443363 [Glandiceps talaboti]